MNAEPLINNIEVNPVEEQYDSSRKSSKIMRNLLAIKNNNG
jgi:hypothetical protein